MISHNPLNGFKKRKDKGRHVNVDEDTLARLIVLPSRETFVGLRDYTLANSAEGAVGKVTHRL